MSEDKKPVVGHYASHRNTNLGEGNPVRDLPTELSDLPNITVKNIQDLKALFKTDKTIEEHILNQDSEIVVLEGKLASALRHIDALESRLAKAKLVAREAQHQLAECYKKNRPPAIGTIMAVDKAIEEIFGK